MLAAEKEGAADRARKDIGRYGDFRPRIGIEADHLTTNRTPGGQPIEAARGSSMKWAVDTPLVVTPIAKL